MHVKHSQRMQLCRWGLAFLRWGSCEDVHWLGGSHQGHSHFLGFFQRPPWHPGDRDGAGDGWVQQPGKGPYPRSLSHIHSEQ